MTDMNGTGPISPRERKMYEQEYKHGADLFQRALEQSSQASNPFQQEQFGEVMQKAMEILNQTAQELKRRDLIDQNAKIAQDYQSYQSNPNDLSKEKLSDDLDQAKRSIG